MKLHLFVHIYPGLIIIPTVTPGAFTSTVLFVFSVPFQVLRLSPKRIFLETQITESNSKTEKQGHVSSRHRYHFHSQLPACFQRRKSELCRVLLTLMEFLARKAAAMQSNKRGMHTLPTSFTASLLGSLSHPLIHFISNTSADHFHHSRQQQSWHVKPLNHVIFPHKPKTNRDLTVFLTGSRGRNQMSFLLRSARVGRKGDSKKIFSTVPSHG